MTAPRFTVTGSDAEGWTVRLVAGNGEVILSSSSQVYADERDAQRAVEIAREAVLSDASNPAAELSEAADRVNEWLDRFLGFFSDELYADLRLLAATPAPTEEAGS